MPRTTLSMRVERRINSSAASGLRAVLLALSLLVADVAGAQAAEVPAPVPAGVEPPGLLEGAEPLYPEEALAAGIEGRVVLRLTIDSNGVVSATEVVESPGHGLDEAALEAASRLRFAPARRDGTPIAARIPYAFDFRLPEPPPEPPDVPAPAEPELEVVVQDVGAADRLRRSARAVQVIETEQARREAADLGEVLARSEGVSVRRTGGLGSQSQFALNGLSGERVRFFLDGVPLDLAGYPFGLASIPVNLVERVEVYRGVVPVAFGADALGGAVNLVSEPVGYGSGGTASYQIGSFGTHRATAGARHLDEQSGIYARVDGFFDTAENDYEVDVMLRDPETLRRYDGTVPLRHAGYQAFGLGVETGLVDRSFADRLALRLFYTDQDRELNHDRTMEKPFGAITSARQSAGGSLAWKAGIGADASLDVVGGYAFNRYGLHDMVPCSFDWSATCHDDARRLLGGELSATTPFDQHIDQHALYARARLGWELGEGHELRLALAPTWTVRDGRNEAVSAASDAVRGEREIVTFVSGLEYEARALDGDLANILFVKHYLQAVGAAPTNGIPVELDRTTSRFGVGDSLRYRLARPLYAKASWELATRLPTPDELFGNGDLVAQNPDLEPEVSHNFNLGLTLERVRSPIGGLRFDINGFARFTDNLILQVAKENFVQHQNVLSATSIGMEAAAGWMLPGDWLELAANATWQDFRNTSAAGAFANYEGDRITNTPWFFANLSARTRFESIVAADDALSLAWITRWINEFGTGWEGVSQGQRITVPSQLIHTAHVGYSRNLDGRLATLGFEIDNLADRKNYDFFGVQRPGRALFAKLTLEL